MCNRHCQEINNSRVVWRGRSPSILNPQQRHARCEDEFLRSRNKPWVRKTNQLLWSKNSFIAPLPPGVRSAWKTGRWPVFSENGPVGPGFPKGREAKARGLTKGGRVPLSGAVQQPLFVQHSTISVFLTASSIRASPSSRASDSRILSSLGWVAGCRGVKTVQQSS